MNILKSLGSKWMPNIDPERIVSGIVTHMGLKKLDKPTVAKELKCPNCGSSRGFYNLFWDAWSCSEDKCLQAHSHFKEPMEKIHIDEKIPSMKDFGVPELYWDANLNGIQNYREFKEFALRPQDSYLFCGQAGRGKTYAACAILNEYRENKGLSARFVSASDLYLRWKDCSRNYGDDLDLAEKYINCQILILDDIGIRTPTDAFLEFLYAIVNARINKKAAFIVTTNMTSIQMNERMGEALTSRFCSGKIIKFEGKDKRINKVF